MSILIKGLEMPLGCFSCGFESEVSYYCTILQKPTTDANNKGERRPDCPLISVPPHGRLVDADKLIWRLTPDEAFYPTEVDRFDYDSSRLMVRDIRSFIRDQPTIIPASEEATP